MCGACSAFGRERNCIKILVENLDLGGKAMKLEGVVGTGWSWLRIGTCGGHLWVR